MAEGESIGLDEYLAQLGELRLVEPVSLENLVGRLAPGATSRDLALLLAKGKRSAPSSIA